MLHIKLLLDLMINHMIAMKFTSFELILNYIQQEV
jgi:hypothetical protein